MSQPLTHYRDILEANVVEGFNLVRMTQKCDGSFNEYTIFEKTKKMIVLGLLSNARCSLLHSIKEFNYPDELEFYYDASFKTDVDINQLEDHLIEEEYRTCWYISNG